MRTVEQIKAEILASNPSRIFTFNGEEIEMSQQEFEKAIEDRAQMEYHQEVFLAEQKAKTAAKISAYGKLGMTNEEIIALLGLSEEEVKSFFNFN